MSTTAVVDLEARSGGPAGPSGGSLPPPAAANPSTGPAGPAKPSRRTFSVDRKLDLLAEYEAGDPLSRGALLRREGIYTSTISQWRQARDGAAKKTLTAVKRGPRPVSAQDKHIARLESENTRLRKELATAEKVIKIQGELAALLEELSTNSATPTSDSKPAR